MENGKIKMSKEEIPKENNCLNCKHSFRDGGKVLRCELGHGTLVSYGRRCFVKDKTKHSKDLSLEYLDGKINRIKGELRELNRVVFKWINETDEVLDELKSKIGKKK